MIKRTQNKTAQTLRPLLTLLLVVVSMLKVFLNAMRIYLQKKLWN